MTAIPPHFAPFLGPFFLVFPCLFFGILLFIGLGWVLPIILGVRQATKKNYSPLWMLFGIHPLGGWIAFIVLACLPPRVQCRTCGGFVAAQFRICPYCRSELAGGAAGAPGQGNPPV